jgi:phosphatidylglycerol:prolipoprotein diacylglycerol transferase
MIYQPINPVAIDLGFAQIHWYGIMYLLAFVAAYLLAMSRKSNIWSKKSIEDMIFYGALGVVVGGRVGD